MPIHEDPNHPHYGPVRRLWIMFAGLDVLTHGKDYQHEWGWSWDEHLEFYLNHGVKEVIAKRLIVWRMLDVVDRLPL